MPATTPEWILMKAITAIGIGVGIGGIMLGALMEGTNPVSLINIPALLIITGGTLGVTMASTSFDGFKTMPTLAIKAFKGEDHDPSHTIESMVELAEKARRNGLLALEEDVNKIDDAYTRRGCSWSSTAPTPTWCGRSSSPRSTRWPSATTTAP